MQVYVMFNKITDEVKAEKKRNKGRQRKNVKRTVVL